MGWCFFGNAAHFQKQGEKAFDADKIKAFLSEKGIASCPTVLKAIREHGNASDKFLKVIETVDLAAVLAQMPECRHLCTTGGKDNRSFVGDSRQRHENAEDRRNSAVSLCGA